MSQEKTTKQTESKPASTEVGHETGKGEEDALNFDELINAKEKVLKKWKQVGQTGGE